MKPDISTLIIYEDPHIIVCHKPAGIATQTSRIGSQDIVSLLKNYLAKQQRRQTPAGRDNAPYLAVIHRLDQPVEGLLVFAKTPNAAKELNRQLTASGFEKHYLALVCGIPVPPEGILADYLIKDGRTNTSRVCEQNTPGAKPARLHYKIKEIRGSISLIEIQLDTGRHHQIRVQMANIGCPLVGDHKYGAPDCPQTTGPLRLCAYRLVFKHPAAGRVLTFTLPDIPF